ncbi:urate oxidase, partial [Geobacillus sp. MMMUD3]|nr:urate oxidase [Geobacillus sp. MMMUD3]
VYNTTDLDFEATYEKVKAIILDAFTDHYSKALQQTLYKMGEKVIDQVDEIDEIRFSCPNKHHFLYDIERFELENPNEVFIVADRPYGLIEATFTRDGVEESKDAWTNVRGFC